MHANLRGCVLDSSYDPVGGLCLSDTTHLKTVDCRGFLALWGLADGLVIRFGFEENADFGMRCVLEGNDP